MQPSEYFGNWTEVISEQTLLKYRSMIMTAVLNGIDFEPVAGKVFKAFRLCPYEDCKIVIIGQDPYPQKGVSTGIAFGNDVSSKDFKVLSPSLKVIKDSVLSLYHSEEIPIFDPSFELWEKQGVLMLNSALTVRTGIPGSHQEAWKPFMEEFISNMVKKNPYTMWVLLGNTAKEFKSLIPQFSICDKHPAYYARNCVKMPPMVWSMMRAFVRDKYNMELQLCK